MAAMLAAAALVAAAPQPGVKQGIESWQKGDYEKAVATWTPLARAGDADAAFNLGQAHRLGRGTPVDLARAQQYFEQAARKGHVDAQTSLGLLLFQVGNRQAGARWLKSAAEAGEPRALLIYGTALFNGDGVPRDAVTAYAMVSRAAAQGLAPAKATLKDMDELLPLDARQKGLALARAMATRGKPAEPRPAAEKPSAPAKVAAPAKPPAPPATVAATPPVTAAPKVGVAPAGGWRIQLGAFGQKATAEALFGKLRGSAAMAGRTPYYVAAGKVIRLQVGPYAKDEAVAACRALAARGQGCFPVRAD